jgi:hypothetical protein
MAGTIWRSSAVVHDRHSSVWAARVTAFTMAVLL